MSLISDKTLRLLGVVTLLLLTFLAYSPALSGEFVWDDDVHITQNPDMLDFAGLKRIWTTTSAVYYPLTSTSFWCIRQVFGLNPLVFRSVNLVVHMLNALLLLMLLKRLRVSGAVFAAMIFSLHPVHVESVAWITELKNLQSVFFFLLAAISYVSFLQSQQKRTFFFTMFFFVLSLLSKPIAIMLPIFFLLFHFFSDQKINNKSWILIAFLFIISGATGAWTVWEQSFHSGALGAEWNQSFVERIIIAGMAIVFYISKLIWPVSLSFIYPRWQIDPAIVLQYLPLLLVVIISLLMWKIKKLKHVASAWFFFIVALFPVLGFFNIYFTRYSYVADHFQYLASIGPITLVAYGLSRLKIKLVSRTIFSSIIIACTFFTWSHAHAFQSPKSLWLNTIHANPKAWLAHTNIGNIYVGEGRLKEAVSHYQQAIEAYPDFAEAHSNLGYLLTAAGQLDRALAHLQKAVKIKPDFVAAYNNLGITFSRLGNFEASTAAFRKALELDSNFVDAHNNLGYNLFQLGKYAEALEYFDEALRLRPDYASAKRNRERTLNMLNRGQGEYRISND